MEMNKDFADKLIDKSASYETLVKTMLEELTFSEDGNVTFNDVNNVVVTLHALEREQVEKRLGDILENDYK